MIARLALLAGAAAFAGLFGPGVSGAAFAAAATTVTTSTSTVHSGPTTDASEDNPDVVPDADVDAAEAEIRQQLHDAQVNVIRKGNLLVVSIGANVLFTYDSYQVSNEGTAAAKALAHVVAEHENMTVEVNGYTDTHGSDEYNQTLSENRANAVAEILIANGVDEARVTSHGFGETHLAVETGDEVKEIKNRRVEVVLHFPPPEVRVHRRHHPRNHPHRPHPANPAE
jgi:outer membrane protein OmpA-like peptidoglycan-associated protein